MWNLLMWAHENEDICISKYFPKVSLTYTNVCINLELLDYQCTFGWYLGVRIPYICNNKLYNFKTEFWTTQIYNFFTSTNILM